MNTVRYRINLLVVASLLLVGCSGNSGVCPIYPTMTEEVGKYLLTLPDNPALDEWLNQQLKLREKLDICQHF